MVVGGWLGLKVDLKHLFAGSDYTEVRDIRRIYEVLERHWSEALSDERMLAYQIGGSFKAEERKNKNKVLYTTSMTRYNTRPFLFQRWKFLGPQDSRELFLSACQRNPDYPVTYFARSADVVVVGTDHQIWVWSVSAQKELGPFSLRPIQMNSAL